MKAIDRLLGTTESRSPFTSMTFSQVLESFAFNGVTYYGNSKALRSPSMSVSGDFPSHVQSIYNSSGVVAAAVVARALLLSQLRFKWRSMVDGDNGSLFGTAELGVLERPGDLTRSELLFTAETHASLAGNAFFHRSGDQVRLLRPDWVTLVFGSSMSATDPMAQTDVELVGYSYKPGGEESDSDPVILLPDEVAHWKPEPDPLAWWRGQSWVGSVLSEINTDRQATTFKSKFFENSATPQLVVTLDPSVNQEQAEAISEAMESSHAGAMNAYKTLFLGGGAEVTVAGSNLQQLDLKNVQGVDETRIALRSRVPATILGIGSGLAGSALNAGNYSQTRRMWSDGWFTPAAQNLCGCLERILALPGPSVELSFDPTQVMFLQDDRLDEAEIQAKNAQTLRTLLDAGCEFPTALNAVVTGDFSQITHSGLFSVQLQPPNSAPATTPQP